MHLDVLVIDTDVETRQEVISQLAGLNVQVAASYRDAAAVLSSCRPHVVIFDLTAGTVEDGISFLRDHKLHSVVAVMTRGPMSDDMECQLLEAGAHAVMVKPVSERKMRLYVQRMLELRNGQLLTEDMRTRLLSIKRHVELTQHILSQQFEGSAQGETLS